MFEVELVSCLTPEGDGVPPEEQIVPVARASWSTDAGEDNREDGEMNDVFATCNGGDQYVRYRTGSSQHVIVVLELLDPSNVAGVSVLIRESPDTDGEGFSGIEIAVSTGDEFSTVYSRPQMFGNFERAGHHGYTEDMAPDFAMGVPTAFIFDAAAQGVTQIQLTLTAADIGECDTGCADIPIKHEPTFAVGIVSPTKLLTRNGALPQPATTV